VKEILIVDAGNDNTLAKAIVRGTLDYDIVGDKEEVIGHKMKSIDASILAEKLGSYDFDPNMFMRRRKQKGNRGQQAKQVARRRVANRLARKNRRLNLRKGNVAGRQ